MTGRAKVPVTERHKAIQAFQGEWSVEQRFFPSPNCDPIVSSGKTVCRVLLGGLAVFMETELKGGYMSIVLTTWNMSKGTYEGLFMDIHSFDGFDPLNGAPMINFPVAKDAKYDLSDAAILAGPARERVWSSRLTVPRMAALVDGGDMLLAGVDSVPVEIVEHRISDDNWILNCIGADFSGNIFVQMENTYTR